MDVHWDPAKARANRLKHGIRFSDAEDVLLDPHALTINDPDSVDEERFISLGRDTAGRTLVIAYTYRNDHVRLISARRANRREVARYEKKL